MLQRARLVETDDRLQIGADDLLAAITATCDRVEQLEPQLCALVPEAERRQRLLDAAASLHALFPDPTHRPPLFGTLVGIKDIVRVDGFATRGGSRLPAELFDGPEAGYVTALRAAGALVLGKTITAEFAYFAPGPTRNPWNLEHTPGGSSSGSAAAVAAGYCPLAIGTQTIGSVIRPAAFCGIVGFKPTFGRIPTAGTIACAPSLDTIGLFAQDVRGITVAAPLLCDNWQPTRSAGAPVLGVPDGPYLEQASPEGRAAFETHLAKLEASGIEVRRIPALAQIEHIMTSNFRLMHGEMARVHAVWFAQYADLYHERTAEAIRIGQAVSDDELELLRPLRGALRAELEGLMQTHGIDLWVCPAAPGPAPAGITTTGNSVMSLPWTFSGLPAISVPAGTTDQGLPLGLQLVAAAQHDERLLLWADMLASIMAV